MKSEKLRFILGSTREAYGNKAARMVMGPRAGAIMQILKEAEEELRELERVAREAELRGIT